MGPEMALQVTLGVDPVFSQIFLQQADKERVPLPEKGRPIEFPNLSIIVQGGIRSIGFTQ